MKIFADPPDFIQFSNVEAQQLARTIELCPNEMKFIAKIQELYISAMRGQNANPSEATLLHLLALIHYNFLFSSITYARGHLAEACNSARVAIDAALIAAHIMYDRASQVAYIERKPPFDKLIRHYNNLIRDKKSLPNDLIPVLIKQHNFFSQYSSHADADSFVYRSELLETDGLASAKISYFQIPQNIDHFKHHFLGLLKTFIVTLDIFSSYFVDERKTSPITWRDELRITGKKIEDRQAQLIPKKA